MKPFIIIILIIVLIISVFTSFTGGIIYADRTCGIPKEANFEVEGYFTNIQNSELSIKDNGYPYFTNGTGASKEEAEDYKKHPENYSAYKAELFFKNCSNYNVTSVFAVLPGYKADYEKVTRKYNHYDIKRKIWINCWLADGGVAVAAGKIFESNIHIIVKTLDMSEQEIQGLLKDLQVNLQIGICEESLNPQHDISRNISFNYPIFYESK